MAVFFFKLLPKLCNFVNSNDCIIFFFWYNLIQFFSDTFPFPGPPFPLLFLFQDRLSVLDLSHNGLTDLDALQPLVSLRVRRAFPFLGFIQLFISIYLFYFYLFIYLTHSNGTLVLTLLFTECFDSNVFAFDLSIKVYSSMKINIYISDIL